MENGVIVYLLGPSPANADEFIISLRLLKRHFLDAHPYPVLCFADSDFPAEGKRSICSESDVDVLFEPVTLDAPASLTEDLPSFIEAYPLGYLHACRFLAGPIFGHPALANYDYCWRLDTDSYIMAPVSYDVFAKLASAGGVYGHLNEIGELQAPPHRLEGLIEASREYAATNQITPAFLGDLLSNDQWDGSVFATSCEVTRLAWWRGRETRCFLEYLDRLGGVYDHCWSVDAIRTLTLAMFLAKVRLHLLWDIHYLHQDYEIEFQPA